MNAEEVLGIVLFAGQVLQSGIQTLQSMKATGALQSTEEQTADLKAKHVQLVQAIADLDKEVSG